VIAFISTVEMKREPLTTGRALVQGTLDMLVLRVLALEPLHGYGVTQRIAQISRGTFEVRPGSLFPAFRRLEREGLVKSEWSSTENNRQAKYYRITGPGRRQLDSETRDWQRQALAIARILAAS
jgi:PadR family transcriptional regulator PadR